MSKNKNIPVDAVEELADKSAQSASIGGTGPLPGEDNAHETVQSESTTTEQQAPDPNQVQVNVDFLRTTRIHFCMPCYGGQLTEATFMSYIKFANLARQLGIEWTIETLVNESLINRARNTLTAKFLHMGTATHQMWIDADIGFQPWHVLVLANHTQAEDVQVVAGLYPMKTLPIRWVINGLENGEERGPLTEVSKAGTGFLMIKRDVYDVLKNHPACRPYKNDIGLDPVYDQYLRSYYDTSIRQNRFYSEDWKMCEDYRDMGGRIWVDRRVLLTHSGHYTFSNEGQAHLLDNMQPNFVQHMRAKGNQVTVVDADGKTLF